MSARHRVFGLIERHPVASVFLVALIARLIIVLFMARYFSGSFVLDDRTYWDLAHGVATGDTANWTDYQHNLYASAFAFTYPLSLVYELFGPAEISGQIFVALLGAGAAAGVTALGKEALSTRIALFAGLVIALLPSQALWSSLILKDASVWFVLVLTALFFARAGRSDGWRLAINGMALFLSLLALAYLREHTVIVACWALVLTGWVGERSMRYQRLLGAVVVALTVPWLAGLGPAGLTFVANAGSVEERRAANAENAASAFTPGRERVATSQLEQSHDRIEELTQKRNQLAAQAASLREEIAEEDDSEADVEDLREHRRLKLIVQQLETLRREAALAAAEEKEAAEQLARIQDAEREPGIAHLARGISVMLAEPYPWDEGTSPSFRMAQAETIVWYPVLILALVGLVPALRVMRVTLFPLVFGGAIMLVYALVEGNVGTAYRHRGEFVWVIALLAGLGLRQLMSWLRHRESSDRDAA